VISRILAKVGFKNVTTVESGEAAMEELLGAEKNYDLVISDLQMPGMSGTELSEAIAEAAALADTNGNSSFRWPVVIGLTADTGLDVAERCRASKMSDVLYKPITVGEVKKYAETVMPFLQPGVWYDSEVVEDEEYSFNYATSLPVQ
jgi:CheY-like chemotaxis protein